MDVDMGYMPCSVPQGTTFLHLPVAQNLGTSKFQKENLQRSSEVSMQLTPAYDPKPVAKLPPQKSSLQVTGAKLTQRAMREGISSTQPSAKNTVLVFNA